MVLNFLRPLEGRWSWSSWSGRCEEEVGSPAGILGCGRLLPPPSGAYSPKGALPIKCAYRQILTHHRYTVSSLIAFQPLTLSFWML